MAGYWEEMRKLVGSRKVILAGVRAVICDDQGRVLLQQRGDFGSWGLPAGALELNESIADALRREVFEETKLTVLSARPYGIYSNPSYSFEYPGGDAVQPFSVAFIVDEWTGTPTPDGDESLQLQFFALDALPPPEQTHHPHRTALRDFRRFLETGEIIVD